MKKFNLLSLGCILVTVTNAFAQTGGKLTLSDSQPKQGQTISLNYQTGLSNTDELKGYMLYLTPKLSYYTVDVSLTKKGVTYESNVAIPDSAVAVGFVFKNKEEQDDNDKKGFAYLINNSSGKPVAGAYRAMSLLNEGLGNYLIGMKIDKEAALADLELSLKNYPELRNDALPAYYSMLAANKKATLEAKSELIKVFTNSDEQAQYNIYYAFNRLDKLTADSLKAIILVKYPNGTLASNELLSKFAREQDLAKMEADYAKIMADKNSKANKDMFTYYMARTYMTKKDYDKLLLTLEKMKVKANAPSILNSAAWPMAESGKDLELAGKLSKQSLAYVNELRTDENYLINYSKSQKEEIINSNYASYSDTYAFVLFKQGKVKDALKYQENAVNLNHFSSAEMNERYTQYLIADNDFKKAEDQLKTLLAAGEATSAMKDQLKEVYLKSHSETEFTTLLASLEKAAKEKARQDLLAKMIDMKSPNFSLKNLKGETVSLASLKGKVVVVDFWATWCGPCKASFPGMQKAVEKYKDTKDVAFVFVDTWESVHDDKRIAAVSKFMDDNKYTFNVLMDTEDAKDKSKYDVVSAFGVDGIPTKFVLDKSGNIRFKAVGFSGSADALVDEVSAMIDLAGNPPSSANIGSK